VGAEAAGWSVTGAEAAGGVRRGIGFVILTYRTYLVENVKTFHVMFQSYHIEARKVNVDASESAVPLRALREIDLLCAGKQFTLKFGIWKGLGLAARYVVNRAAANPCNSK
jgi:hypothetical protein